MKIFSSFCLFLFLFFSPSLVLGYGNAPDNSCPGESFCVAILDGFDFSDFDSETNSTICKFGETNLGSTTRCDVPCKEDIFYNCTCVSESVAKEGLIVDSLRALSIAVSSFGILFLAAAVHALVNMRFNAKVDKFIADYNAEKERLEKNQPVVAASLGDEKGMNVEIENQNGRDIHFEIERNLMRPVPPITWPFFVIYLVMGITGIAYLVDVVAIRSKPFWNGC